MNAPRTNPALPKPERLANRIALSALAALLALCWAIADGALYGVQP